MGKLFFLFLISFSSWGKDFELPLRVYVDPELEKVAQRTDLTELKERTHHLEFLESEFFEPRYTCKMAKESKYNPTSNDIVLDQIYDSWNFYYCYSYYDSYIGLDKEGLSFYRSQLKEKRKNDLSVPALNCFQKQMLEFKNLAMLDFYLKLFRIHKIKVDTFADALPAPHSRAAFQLSLLGDTLWIEHSIFNNKECLIVSFDQIKETLQEMTNESLTFE